VSTGTGILCPCLSGRTLDECCGPFEKAPAISGSVPVRDARASLRRNLLNLVRHVQSYMEVWFSFADSIPPEFHAPLPDRPAWELEQTRLELYLWDYFQQISQARPILRIARDVEPTDLRFANRLDDWSLRPWEPFEALRRHPENDSWDLRNLASGKPVHAHLAYAHHALAKGDVFAARILAHGGHSFTGLSLLHFPRKDGPTGLVELWKKICKRHGVTPLTQLRPDVHNEIWFDFHLSVMEHWAALPDDALSARNLLEAELESKPPQSLPDLDKPVSELGHQSPRQAATHALGRHRLKLWIESMEARGLDAALLRKSLKI
jgi:hypothetical protein